jgi:hypothetical protein
MEAKRQGKMEGKRLVGSNSTQNIYHCNLGHRLIMDIKEVGSIAQCA